MSALMWSVQDQKGNNALCGLLGAAAVPETPNTEWAVNVQLVS